VLEKQEVVVTDAHTERRAEPVSPLHRSGRMTARPSRRRPTARVVV